MRCVSGGYLKIVRPHRVVTVDGSSIFRRKCNEFPRALRTFKTVERILVRFWSYESCRDFVTFVTLENSTLRQVDLDLSLRIYPCFLERSKLLAWCSEYPQTVECIWTRHSHRNQIDRRLRLCYFTLFFVFLLHPFRHWFWAAGRGEILRAAKWAEMILDTCLIVELLPFMIILLIESMFYEDAEHRTKMRRLHVLRKRNRHCKIQDRRARTGFFVWILVCFFWGWFTQQVSLCSLFGFFRVGWKKNRTLH